MDLKNQIVRNIKFRVWDIPNNCFIPNDYYVISNDGKSLGMIIKDWNNYQEGEYMYSPNQTLSQFTGLLDKNGTPVYEGDIVTNEYNEKRLVKWITGNQSVVAGHGEMSEITFSGFKVETHGNKYTVIGNQFQNPELL